MSRVHCIKCRKMRNAGDTVTVMPPNANHRTYALSLPLRTVGLQNSYIKEYATDNLPKVIHNNILRHGYSEIYICHWCVVALELECIAKMPIQELPLYINEQWLSEKAQKAFRKRLTELV